MKRTAVVSLGLALGWSGAAFAQAGLDHSARPTPPGTVQPVPDAPPGFAILRQDEDWRPVSDRAPPPKGLDTLKHIVLDRDRNVTASLAVDGYLSFRQFGDELLGAFPGLDGTFNQRLNVDLSLTFGDRLRLYGALKRGEVDFRRTPVSPVNRDRLDVHQAFAELAFGDLVGLRPDDLSIRVGRQEIYYGAGRVISARLGPNVRDEFDGVQLRARAGNVVADAFVMRATTDAPGVFDNGPDNRNLLWGAYATRYGTRLNIDAIYIAQRSRGSVYAFTPIPFNETRHTVGARLWSQPSKTLPLAFDLEAEYQFGIADGTMGQRRQRISAWSIAGNVTYSWVKANWQPQLGFEFGATSGDGDPGNETIGTFRAVAPPGRYFGEANPFGPGNIGGVRGFVLLRPLPAFTIKPKITLLWRLETTDGSYTLGRTPLRGARGNARYAGSEPGVELSYSINRRVTLTGFLARFVTGRYLQDNQPVRDITYVETTIAFKL